MNIYESNLEALAKIEEELYLKLKNIKTNETFEVFLAENDIVANANIIDHRDKASIHKSAKDLSEKIKEFEEFDNYHSLYFFGIGSGSLYEKLLQNANHQSIMVIEPEIELIYIALNLFDFSKEILSNRFKIKLSETITQENLLVSISYGSRLFLKTYNLHLYSSFYEKYSEEISRVSSVFLSVFEQVIYQKGDSLTDTLTGLSHSTSHMLNMIKQPSLDNLINKIKNRKSAVLVSTGPSLYKQLPLLKKVQDYITILCADASFPILSKEGIKPDVVLSMERVKESAKFYANTPDKFHKEVVFLLATVCHDETYKSIDSEGILSPFMRADNHNRILGLDEWGYLGGGLSSANYLYNVAMYAEFESFTFIGQDLAYGKDGSSHCKNHVFGADELGAEKAIGSVVAYGGIGKVRTTRVWNLFLNDFNLQVNYVNKSLNMKTYNSTEGGARINGTVEIPFQDFCDKFVNLNIQKEKIVLDVPSPEMVENNTKKYLNKQKEVIKLATSISKNAKKVFNETELFLEKIKDYSEEEIVQKVSTKELDKLNKRLSDLKNKYASKAFSDIFESLLLSYISHLDFDIAQVKVMRENTPDTIKLKKTNWVKVHYEWSYRLYSTLNEIIKIIENSFTEDK